jgi:4-amino-4-deoxychorismate lyase
VAVLGLGVVDSAAMVLAADDLGLTRGDGCFEATRVVTDAAGGHRIDHLAEHLTRFHASSTALGLPGVDASAWRELIGQLLAGWAHPGEAMLRLMITRGRESDPSAGITGIATLTALAPSSLRQRREGISVLTLPRGVASDAYADTPWLLGGVKTLSYAVNVAAARWASTAGVDDVIFTSTDGFVLEAPTSAVIWAQDGGLFTTPTGATGILDSITQKAVYVAAAAAGVRCEYRLAAVKDLLTADGVWLVSSGRGPAAVRVLDGAELTPRPELVERLREWSGFAAS